MGYLSLSGCVFFFFFNGYCVYIYKDVIIYVIYIYIYIYIHTQICMFYDFHGNIWNFYDTL